MVLRYCQSGPYLLVGLKSWGTLSRMCQVRRKHGVASFRDPVLNGAESQIARTPKFEFIINPCPTKCRATADGDRTDERIISLRCQSAACSVGQLRELKLLNAEIIVFSLRWKRAYLIGFAEFFSEISYVCCGFQSRVYIISYKFYFILSLIFPQKILFQMFFYFIFNISIEDFVLDVFLKNIFCVYLSHI